MITMTWWFYWFSIALVATATTFVAYWTGVSAGERSARKKAAPENVWNNVRVVPDKSPVKQEQP